MPQFSTDMWKTATVFLFTKEIRWCRSNLHQNSRSERKVRWCNSICNVEQDYCKEIIYFFFSWKYTDLNI